MDQPRILVADDDAWILRMVTTVLEKRGYIVETAADGEEAYLRALEEPPDLVITDVMMPKMDGWDLIRALRSRAEFAFVPVIFLTALSSDDDRIRGFRLGADDYLTKPFRFEELDLRVEKTLKRGELVEQMARERLGSTRPGPAPAPAKPVSAAPPANSRAGSDPEPPPNTDFAGRLQEVGLPALLTLLEMEQKSGILLVSQGADPDAVPSGGGAGTDVGRIYLGKGRVLAAHLDAKDQPRDAECIYYMLEWKIGQFEFEACELDMEDQIGQSTSFLLMEGARRMDERNAV